VLLSVAAFSFVTTFQQQKKGAFNNIFDGNQEDGTALETEMNVCSKVLKLLRKDQFCNSSKNVHVFELYNPIAVKPHVSFNELIP